MLYYYIEKRYMYIISKIRWQNYMPKDINFVLLSYIYDKDKIRFEWVDIIYDMSKAKRSVSLIPFNPIRQPALWILPSLYKVWSRWYDTDSNLRPFHPDPGLLLLSQICWVSHLDMIKVIKLKCSLYTRKT